VIFFDQEIYVPLHPAYPSSLSLKGRLVPFTSQPKISAARPPLRCTDENQSAILKE